jgi:hypothetical protein
MLGRRDLQSRRILLSLYAMDSVRGIAILPPHCQSVKTTDKVRFTHLVGYAFPTGNSWYSPGVPNLEPESGGSLCSGWIVGYCGSHQLKVLASDSSGHHTLPSRFGAEPRLGTS